MWPGPGREPSTTGEVTAQAGGVDLTIGLAVAQLLCYGQEWVARRTETFAFTSADTVQRQMGVDFALPQHPTEEGALDIRAVREMVNGPGPTLVPLATLEKQPLTAFDLFDEERRTLPLLTTAESGRVSGEALLALALGRKDAHELRSLPGSVARALAAIAQLPQPEAEVLRDCLFDGVVAHSKEVVEKSAPPPEGGEDPRSKEARKELLVRAKELCKLEAEHETVAAHVRALMREEPLRALTRKLASDFVVLIPLEHDAFRRRVIKFSYQKPLLPRRPPANAPRLRHGMARLARKLSEWLSWRPKEFSFSQIAAGQSEGHHIEMMAPGDMNIVKASFEAHVRRPAGDRPEKGAAGGGPAATARRAAAAARRPEGPEAHPEVRAALGRGAVEALPAGWVVLDPPQNQQRAHLNLRKLAPQAHATARVQLCASPGGTLNAAVCVALLIVAIFFWGQSRVGKIEADAAAAILLAVPTVIAAYISRPGEHELVSVVLGGVRVLVACSGVLMFVAAASVAFGYKDGELANVWCYLKFASLLPAAGLVWSSLRVRWPNLRFRKWLSHRYNSFRSSIRRLASRKRRRVRHL